MLCKFRSKAELHKVFGIFYALFLLAIYAMLLGGIFVVIPVFVLPPTIISPWWAIFPILGAANFILCSNSIFVIIFRKMDRYLDRWI